MQIPAGFNVSGLVNDFISCMTPFAALVVLVVTGALVLKMLKRY